MGILICSLIAAQMSQQPLPKPLNTMQEMMIQYDADRSALNRLYTFEDSSTRIAALSEFFKNVHQKLEDVSFQQLNQSDRADWVLMNIELSEQLQNLKEQKENLQETEFLHPFLSTVSQFNDHRISRSLPNSQEFAQEITDLEKNIKQTQSSIQNQIKEAGAAEKVAQENVALRAIATLQRSQRALDGWYDHFAGYDPLFTWWCKKPVEDCLKTLETYTTFLRREFTGKDSDPNKIVGDPVGREALVAALAREMIDYTPEELINIAENEMAWVDAEFKKASRELGYGDDWRAALEYVKTLHEEPGSQPRLIQELAEEAIDYIEKYDLMTIPPLAKDVWRMDMMSPERQLVSPFFLGGESIIISFPTDAMTHEQKIMSLKSNNRHFAKATVHHELIPGHHMQFFMTSRYNTHRNGISGTPFWVEGWALYWEFLLYKRGFAATPEERIGFLFWRKHRCARIIFSLKFHLGQMTAQECITMLTDVVGHEKSTAEGEVRRSFGGTYPPLYQAAYMLGALQLWQIRRELVDSGKMPEKEFHDQIMKSGNMPWAVLRKLLSGEEIDKKLAPWKFYNGNIEN